MDIEQLRTGLVIICGIWGKKGGHLQTVVREVSFTLLMMCCCIGNPLYLSNNKIQEIHITKSKQGK